MKQVYSSNEKTVQAFFEGQEDCRSGGGNVFATGQTLYSYGTHFPLAIRLDGLFLINGDSYSNSTSKHTSYCIRILTPNVQIPFSGLKSALIEPENIKIVHYTKDRWEDQEYIDPKTKETKTREIHFLGQVLFKYKRSFYLSGFDSQESLSRRSYFLTKLTKPASRIDEALEGLKPEAVKQADLLGQKYQRQGEWFFIEKPKVETRQLKRVGKMIPITRGNSHIATEVRKDDQGNRLVRGFVRHRPGRGRNPQHGMLKLGKTWHRIVKNTARKSWQAEGLVD